MIASTWDLGAFEDSCHLQYAKKQIASTWDLDTFEDSDPMLAMRTRIVSTWDLVNSEGYGGWVKDDFMFINLGSGELRGLVCRADHSLGHCINLESGTKARTIELPQLPARALYQPGICSTPRATAVGSRTTSCSSTWGPANSEDMCAALIISFDIVSTWVLDTFEDR